MREEEKALKLIRVPAAVILSGIVCMVSVGLLILGLFFGRFAISLLVTNQVKQSGVQTQAVVLHKSTEKRSYTDEDGYPVDTTTYILDLSFSDLQHKKHELTVTTTNSQVAKSLKVGNKLPIRYLAEDPQFTYTEAEDPTAFYEVALAVSGILMLVTSFLFGKMAHTLWLLIFRPQTILQQN